MSLAEDEPFSARSPDIKLLHSSINTECIQLLRHFWNIHDEASEFITRIRLILCRVRRIVRCGHQQKITDDDSIHENLLQSASEQLKTLCDSISDAHRQFIALSQFQSHCKLITYSKIRQAKQVVYQDRLAILFYVSALIHSYIELFWSTVSHDGTGKETGDGNEDEHLELLTLTHVYNTSLEALWMAPSEATIVTAQPPSEIARNQTQHNRWSENVNRVKVVVQLDGANNNDSPLLKFSLKALPIVRVLEQLASKKALHVSRLISINFASLCSADKEPMVNDNSEIVKMRTNLQDLAASVYLDGFFRSVSKVPGLLPRGKSKKGETDRGLTSNGKKKYLSIFQHYLWSLVGETTPDTILWSNAFQRVPYILKPGGELKFNTVVRSWKTTQKGGGGDSEEDWARCIHAMETIFSAIQSFTQVSKWDEKMIFGIGCARKIKRAEQVSVKRNPTAGEWSSDIGERFGDISANCLTLVGGSSQIDDTGPLEASLGDEAGILFRLDATLAYFHSWMVRRAKVWLNGWAIPQFIACSQRDTALIVNLVRDKKNLLATRQLLLTVENVCLRLAALQRQMCTDDLTQTLNKLSAMPDELVLAVGPVSQTLSLATLQSYMPPASHWRGVGPNSGLDPDKPSAYVQVFIDRVVEPVMSALVEYVGGPVQEAMGKQVIQAACEAWLQFILQRKIQFSEWGAVQLLRDFLSLRDWIRNNDSLEAEARKALLQLEVLKRCEGVAYLLLRSPGDVLGVGKPTRKTRRVAPSDSNESSPSASMNSVAEDDIPPEMYVPNQQMWLELRLGRSILSSPCCTCTTR